MQASAKVLLVAPIGNTSDSMHKLVDKLMDRLPHHRWLQTNAKELEPLNVHVCTVTLAGLIARGNSVNPDEAAEGQLLGSTT